MLSDALLAFVPYGAPLSMVGTAGQRSNILDFLGQGAGTPPQNIFGNSTVFGQADAMGVGPERMELLINTGAAAFVGAGVTLNVQLQAAADQGVAGGYQPGAWNTLSESGPIAVANLAALTTIFRSPWLPPFPANLRPRFLSLNFVVAGGQFTTGVIAFALPVPARDDQFNKYQPRNFNV
jgi:hypothetical protein